MNSFKIKYFIRLMIISSIIFFPDNLFAYDETIVHPSLTSEMAKLYNLGYDDKLTDQETEWMKKGSTDEDKIWGGIKIIRSANHFYNPLGTRGWVDGSNKAQILSLIDVGETSKQWAHDSVAQSEYVGGDYTWERAIYDYVNGDKQHAYESLGHIMHLIEDATVPAHVRSDLHISPKEAAAYKDSPITQMFFDFEPYEGWTGGTAYWKDLKLDFSSQLFRENKKPIALGSLDEYFANVAGYTNNNFFSKDTISAYPMPLNYSKEGSEKVANGDIVSYVYGFDENGGKFKLARIYGDLNSKQKVYKLDDGNSEIHSDYWSHLAPKAVLAGAGIIKLFKDEVKKVQQNPTAVKKPDTFVTYYVAKPITAVGTTAGSGVLAASSVAASLAVSATGALSNAVNQFGTGINNLLSSTRAVIVQPFVSSDSTSNSSEMTQSDSNYSDQATGEIQSEELAGPAENSAVNPVYDAELILDETASLSFEPGQDINLNVKIKNIGTVVWQRDEISLGVYLAPADAAKFYHPAWLTAIRTTLLEEQTLAPNAIGNFDFIIKSPSAPGDYFFRAMPEREDADSVFSWMGKNIVSWTIKVNPPALPKNAIASAMPAQEIAQNLSGENQDSANNSQNKNIGGNNNSANTGLGNSSTDNSTVNSGTSGGNGGGGGYSPVYYGSAALTPTPTPTPSASSSPSPSPSPTPEVSPSPLPNPSPEATDGAAEAAKSTPSPTPTPTFTPTPTPLPTPLPILISEAAAGIGNAENEFIELYNMGGTPINLKESGIKLILVDSSDNDTIKRITWATEIIGPRGFFLFGTGNVGLALDAAYSNGSLTGVSGVIIADKDGNTIDKVSWGEKPPRENLKSPPLKAAETEGLLIDQDGGLKTGQSLERKADADSTAVSLAIGGADEYLGNGYDTDNNSADFILQDSPNPQNSKSPAEPEIIPTPTPTPEPSTTPTPEPSPSSTPAPPPVYNVNKSIYYTAIQDAIDAATPGDEIDVNSDVLRECRCEQKSYFKRN